jgi:hypothetical protein
MALLPLCKHRSQRTPICKDSEMKDVTRAVKHLGVTELAIFGFAGEFGGQKHLRRMTG